MRRFDVLVSSVEKQGERSYRWTQIRMFCLTYVTYVVVYFLRKPWSTCKAVLGDDLNADMTRLGFVDTCFLAAYAAGQIFLSPLGDRYGPKRMIIVVLIGSAIMCAIVGVSSNFNVV